MKCEEGEILLSYIFLKVLQHEALSCPQYYSPKKTRNRCSINYFLPSDVSTYNLQEGRNDKV